MPIGKRTIEELIARNDAAILKAKADIALADAENSAFRKILAMDAAPVVTNTKTPSETLQRLIASIQAAGKPLTVEELLRACDIPDSKATRHSVNMLMYKRARDGKIFVKTAPNTYGLLVMGHVAAGAPRVIKLMGAEG